MDVLTELKNRGGRSVHQTQSTSPTTQETLAISPQNPNAHPTGGGATTTGPDATPPPLSVKTWGRGWGGSGGGVGWRVWGGSAGGGRGDS